MANTVELKAVLNVQDNATKKVQGFNMSLGKMASAVGIGTIAANAFNRGINFLTGQIDDSIKAFIEEEAAVARLRAGMKNTTPEWEKGTDALLAQAAALQKVTTFGDEQIVSAQAMLSTFMLNDRQIEKLTPSILDMASALQKTEGAEADLQQLSILLGKAIGGEDVAGLSGALRRVGIVMTNTQTKILETGKMEERLNTITEIIAQNFGGFAAEAVDTYGGKLKQMNNVIGDVKEKFGQALLQGLAPFIEKLTTWVSKPETQKFISDLANNLGNIATNVFPILVGGIATLNHWWNILIGTLSNVIQKYWEVENAIKSVIEKAKDVKPDWLHNNPGDTIKDILGFRQMGGSVNAGKPYVVGEAGAELFVPKTSGTIVPNNKLGGVTINVTGNTVRSDNDLQRIISEIKRALNRDLSLEGLRV